MDRAWLFPVLIAAALATMIALVGMTITDIGPWYHGLKQPHWAPPEAAYGVASELARMQGRELKTSKEAIRDRLKQKGHLAGHDKGHLTTRKTFKGQKWAKMLHVRWDIAEQVEDDEMGM